MKIENETAIVTGGASGLGAAFVDKGSATLLQDLRGFMRDYLGFGDFVFRRPDGTRETSTGDIRGMMTALRTVSDESLLYHAARNDFSTWLMARTEFDLARALRPQKVDDFDSIEDLREYLLESFRLSRQRSRAGQVEVFSGRHFDADTEFARIGDGSLGGKGRGLAFVNSLLSDYDVSGSFEGVRIFVPPSAVLATDLFDEFMDGGSLRRFVFSEAGGPTGDGEYDLMVTRRFLEQPLPEPAVSALRTFLDKVRYPLAVRSSSLLEDSPSQPFAGVYGTFMLPNDHPDPEFRLARLCDAVRMVYASTYQTDARNYISTSPNRLEEEKMAVVIQQVVGGRHDGFFYPVLSGVARSYNLYPIGEMDPAEGVASIALGLGTTVVEGGKCISFSPGHPGRLYQFASPRDYLDNSQRSFAALRFGGGEEQGGEPGSGESMNLVDLRLEDADAHGTLAPVGSVYSAENDMVVEGTNRPGIKVVSMAGMLKGYYFDFAGVLAHLLKIGSSAFSCHVEIEFAVNPGESQGERSDFGFLQIRPMPFASGPQVALGRVDREDAVCLSSSVLGFGLIEGIRDILWLDAGSFDRSEAARAASEVSRLNQMLLDDARPYVLIGPGRWGSSDPWLGVPVRWAQIAGARCIVETPLPGVPVDPSQGTHFFQNITSLGIGYFTIGDEESFVNDEWLRGIRPSRQEKFVRLLSFDEELQVLIDSKAGRGAVMKPGRSAIAGREDT